MGIALLIILGAIALIIAVKAAVLDCGCGNDHEGGVGYGLYGDYSEMHNQTLKQTETSRAAESE